MVSLSSDIILKSLGTRNHLESLLWEHFSSRASSIGISYSKNTVGGRYLIEGEGPLLDLLQSQFGFSKIYRCLWINGEDVDWVSKIAPKGPFTFVVYAKSTSLVPLKRWILEKLKELAFERLSLWDNRPCGRIEIRLEEVEGKVLVLWDARSGLGGLPLGSGGDVVHLFSGGPDSVLAALMMVRRGQNVHLLFMDDGEVERFDRVRYAAEKVAYFMRDMKVRLVRVPFKDTLELISSEAPSRHTCLFCKAFMLLVASKLADEIDAVGISSGDMLGEQASQTPYNLLYINSVATLPVYRPLAGFNKEEVFDFLKRFGVEDERNFNMPSCPFVPKRPVAKPRVSLGRFLNFVTKLPLPSWESFWIEV